MSTPSSLPQPIPSDPSPTNHPRNKPCTLCGTPRPVLVRCQIDESGAWHFLCTGKCWTAVSGGVEDAKEKEAEFPFYRYGGMWKNKHALVSAKKPKSKSEAKRSLSPSIAGPSTGLSDSSGHGSPAAQPPTSPAATLTPARATDSRNHQFHRQWSPSTHYTRNDTVRLRDKVWICRRSHVSRPDRLKDKDGEGEGNAPEDLRGYRYWKEDDSLGTEWTGEDSEGGELGVSKIVVVEDRKMRRGP